MGNRKLRFRESLAHKVVVFHGEKLAGRGSRPANERPDIQLPPQRHAQTEQ